MKLFDKIKNALFEEEEQVEKEVKEEKLVKKIDVLKTVKEEKKVPIKPVTEEIKPIDIRFDDKPKGPIIFDDEDFLNDTKEVTFKEIPKKEEKILYGGYRTSEVIKQKEKFNPRPIISPVYGVLGVNYTIDNKSEAKKSLDHLFSNDKVSISNIDSIKEKSIQRNSPRKKEQVLPEIKNPLLYDMEDREIDDRPIVENITIGDAEEYFNDLGLEYGIDYKDKTKESPAMSRIKKNEELASSVLEDMLKEEKDETNDKEAVDEKNLYDLINMMYENKE